MLKSEQFRAKVSTDITDPLYAFDNIAHNPFYSFNDVVLETIRMELVGKVNNFWALFREHSAGGFGYYDYIDIPHIRRFILIRLSAITESLTKHKIWRMKSA